MGAKKKLALIVLVIFVALIAWGWWRTITSPKAEVTVSSIKVGKGETVFFSGKDSMDPNGKIISYEWDFGDGSEAEGVNVEHSYTKGGIYTVKLTVTDDDDLSDVYEVNIEVVLTPPQPAISVKDTEVEAGETVVFDATNSKDLDGEIISYEWDFGDGTTASGMVAEHSYKEIGTYDVSLKVVDDDGLSDVATVKVYVKPTEYMLAQAVEEKVVQAKITGLGGYNLLRLELEALVPYNVNIIIPKGTVFLATGDFSDMIHAEVLGIFKGFDLLDRSVKYEPVREIVLKGNETKTYVLETYCLDFYKRPPSTSSIFEVDALADPRIMKILDAVDELPTNVTSYEAIQAAIWAVTEDASRFELMERFQIDLEDVENARIILETAFVDISIHVLSPPYDFVDAFDKGLVEVELTGKGLCAGDAIKLKITPKLEVSIDIEITPGLILINSGPGQNMIIAEAETITVKPEIELDLDIEAYCLDSHKDNPSSEETFSMQTDPGIYGEDVISFMKSLEDVPLAQKPVSAVQIALWVITDDISREDIRIWFSEGDIEAAKQLLENAGIDISGKKLFQED